MDEAPPHELWWSRAHVVCCKVSAASSRTLFSPGTNQQDSTLIINQKATRLGAVQAVVPRDLLAGQNRRNLKRKVTVQCVVSVHCVIICLEPYEWFVKNTRAVPQPVIVSGDVATNIAELRVPKRF